MRATPRSRALLLVVLLATGGAAVLAAPEGVPALFVGAPLAQSLPAPPELRLRAPVDGAGVGLVVRLAGEALAKETSLEAVEVRVDGGAWRPATLAPPMGPAAPFHAEIAVPAGDHLVEARARGGNASSVIARALVRAAPEPPATVRILSPPDGQGVAAGELTVTGTLVGDAPVVVSAAGQDVLARVLPGGLWEATVELPVGEHLVAARTQGPRAGLPASVRVAAGETPPPTLVVAAPREGAAFGSAGDPACAEGCVLFVGSVDGEATAVQAKLDGERAPGAAPLLVGGAWTYRLPMSRLYAGEHRVEFTPVAPERQGLPQAVTIVVATPRAVEVTGDLDPAPTLTPLFLEAGAAPDMRVRWSVDGVFLREGPNATITFARPGGHDVRVEAVDARGRVADVLHTLVALDRPPAVTLSPPRVDGSLATLVASASDPDGVVVEYAWEFGDGRTSTTSGPTVRHRYAEPGAYRVNVTAVDELGARSAPASVLVAISGAAPRARFSWAPFEPSVLDVVTFRDESGEADRIVARAWDIGGASADSVVARHQFARRGEHPVTLRIVDAEGVESTLTQVVRVRDLPPAAAFAVVPPLPRTGEPVLFVDASTDPDGPVVAWRWDFGDGGNATGRSVSHVFGRSGEHRVVLRAIDDMGVEGLAEASIVVEDVEPDLANVTVEPERPRAKDEVRFGATPVDAEGLVSVVWDFGDGVRAQGTQVAHRYARSGQYTVNVTVVDGVGQMRTRLFPLSVANAPPAVAMDAPGNVYAAFRALFQAEAQDPDGRVSTYSFDLDGDGDVDCTGPEPTCAHVYERPGTYVARVQVFDDEGGNGTSSAVVDVLVPPDGLAPPRVTIGHPPGGGTVRGLLRAEGTAAGPRPVKLVEAQLREDGWTLTGPRPWQSAAGGETWRLAIDTAAFPDGDYDLVVRATDEGGAQGLAVTRITLANGARPSEVTLRILQAPEVVTTRDVVRGTAYHPDGITAVRWRLDDGPWTPALGPPLAFEVPLDARGLPPGDHVLTIAAYRGVADHREVTRVVTVPGAIPQLVVDAPPTEIAYGLLRAAGRITGGGHAEWRLDHGLWRALPGGPAWLLDEETRAMPGGPHRLQIRAVSDDGRYTSEVHEWKVEIVNPPPPAKRAAPPPAAAEQEVPFPGVAPLALAIAIALALLRHRSGSPPARP